MFDKFKFNFIILELYNYTIQLLFYVPISLIKLNNIGIKDIYETVKSLK